ncbi:MAG: hypothetical protein MUP90_13270, partial [Gammaproteobacteria bacterium]|nr:hypothetical protein [Gammaproteobacteria bacterium]
MATKKITLILLLAALTAGSLTACGPGKDELAAQQALDEIYAQRTAEAAAAVEAAPAEEAPPAPEPAPEEPKESETLALTPGEPPEPERTLEDYISWYAAAEKKGVGGDNFLDNVYERPFTSV